MIKLIRIHHIAIICNNYETSKKFYTEILGFKIIKESYRKERDSYKLDLSLNNQYLIELFSFKNPPKRLTNPESTGLRHLSFEVDNLFETVHELKNQNVESEEIRIDQYTRKKYTFIRDPDKLPIELYEK